MIFKLNGATMFPIFRKRYLIVHFTPEIQIPTGSPETFFVPYVRKVIEAYDLEDTDISHYDYFAYERDNNQGFAVVVMLKEGSAALKPQIADAVYSPAAAKDYFYCVDYTGNANGVNNWTTFCTTTTSVDISIQGITNVIYTTRNLYASDGTVAYTANTVTADMQERFSSIIAKITAGQPAVLEKLQPYLQKVINNYSSELDTTQPLSEYQVFAFERINNLGFGIGVVPKAKNPNRAYPYYYTNYYKPAGSVNYFLFRGYDGTETYMKVASPSQVNGLNSLFFTTININYASSGYKYCGYVDNTILERIQANGLLHNEVI